MILDPDLSPNFFLTSPSIDITATYGVLCRCPVQWDAATNPLRPKGRVLVAILNESLPLPDSLLSDFRFPPVSTFDGTLTVFNYQQAMLASLEMWRARWAVALDNTSIPSWVSGQSYVAGQLAANGGNFYKCTISNNDAAFDATKWTQLPATTSGLTLSGGRNAQSDFASALAHNNDLYSSNIITDTTPCFLADAFGIKYFLPFPQWRNAVSVQYGQHLATKIESFVDYQTKIATAATIEALDSIEISIPAAMHAEQRSGVFK